MASLLRSVRYVRKVLDLSRNIASIPVARNESGFLQPCKTLANNFKHGFATKPQNSIAADLERISEQSNRHGRIFRSDVNELLRKVIGRRGRPLDGAQCLMVIKCLGNPLTEEIPEVRTKLVQELWASLLEQNLKLDISHYNALVRVYVENGHKFSPAEFLANLKAKNLIPNRATYQRLVEQYCKQGDVEGATNMLMLMKENNISINEQTFNALIIGHAQSGDLESAVGVISQMKERGLEPNIDTYTNVLCSYAKTGDLDAIRKTIDQCKTEEIQLSDRSILEVIYVLSVNGHTEKIDEVLQFAQKSREYNQSAVNVILRLVNQGHDDAAYTVLKTMQRRVSATGKQAETGNFLIKHMVKRNRPIEKITAICEDLQQNELNVNAMATLQQAILKNATTEYTLNLLREQKAKSEPIQQEQLFPLLRAEASNGDIGKLLQTLADEFDFKPNARTIRDSVVRNMNVEQPERTVETLRKANVSMSTAVSSVIYNCLVNKHLKEAVDLAYQYETYLEPNIFQDPLTAALKSTNDIESYLKLVRYIHDNYSRREKIESIPDKLASVTDVLGEIVYNTLSALPERQQAETFTKIVRGLVEDGLTISKADDERIRAKLDSRITDEIASLLTQLASGELKPVPVERTKRKTDSEAMTSEKLEKYIKSEEAAGKDTARLRQWLLQIYVREKKTSKLEEYLSNLENEKDSITDGNYAGLIELQAIDDFDKALKTFEKVRLNNPEFALNSTKTLSIVQLLLENQRTVEALKFLEANKKISSLDENDDSYNYNRAQSWRILNSLAEAGNADDVQQIYDSLMANNYAKLDNVLLGPLVKVHLVNDDVKKAVDTFEKLSNEHNLTPMKNELFSKLIQNEDPETLQLVTDISSRIHGEHNSLLDLAFSFVELGRIRPALKIFETPGLIFNIKKINHQSERYERSGNLEHLENLVKITKNLHQIDRSAIFESLLTCYVKADLPEKALDLWVQLQEENGIPSDTFLLKLGTFLKRKNIDVPFDIPASQTKHNQTPKNVQASKSATKPVEQTSVPVKTADRPKQTQTLTNFAEALKSKNIDRIRETYSQLLPTDVLSVTRSSSLIQNLMSADDMSTAKDLVLKMLNENTFPHPPTFKYFLRKLAASGDVQSFNELSTLLTDNGLKRILTFDNFECNAYEAAGRGEEYLQNVKTGLDGAKNDEEHAKLIDEIAFDGIFDMLIRNPALLPQVEDLATKTTTKDNVIFQNILWNYHFSNGNDKVCQKIWTEHLQTAPKFRFGALIKKINNDQNEQLAGKLIDFLEATKASEHRLGIAYGGLLEVHCTKGQFDQGLEILQAAVKKIPLNQINTLILQNLKKGIQSTGKVFPYTIPSK